jgi:hypothetical protein
MSRQFLLTLAAALIVIGVALYSTVSVNQRRLLTLTGSITNVRPIALTLESSLVIVDFTATNPSPVGFDLIQLELDKLAGEKATPSGLLSKSEIARYFEYNKIPQPNPVLGIGELIKAGETVHRIVVGRFELPVDGLATSAYRIRFRHIDKVDAEISGKRP